MKVQISTSNIIYQTQLKWQLYCNASTREIPVKRFHTIRPVCAHSALRTPASRVPQLCHTHGYMPQIRIKRLSGRPGKRLPEDSAAGRASKAMQIFMHRALSGKSGGRGAAKGSSRSRRTGLRSNRAERFAALHPLQSGVIGPAKKHMFILRSNPAAHKKRASWAGVPLRASEW